MTTPRDFEAEIAELKKAIDVQKQVFREEQHKLYLLKMRLFELRGESRKAGGK